MCAWNRHLATCAAASALLLFGGPAGAWVETTLRSDVVTIDLDRSGRALVAHEIVMKVKGGPLEGFDLDGVDADAELLPDASVTPALSGAAAGTPLPLLLQKRDDGVLRIEIDNEKGIRRGTYLFKLSYRTNLLAREQIKASGAFAEITWVGPRFADGIDSARAVFRIPPSGTPPKLPEFHADQAALGLTSDFGGIFLSNLRRAADKDELEVVRPHVAKGEPVVWRVLASTKAFDAFEPPPAPAVDTTLTDRGERPAQRIALIGAAVAIALIYAGLVALKWRAVAGACALANARARALIPLGAPLRAALSGATLAAAVAVGLATQLPTLAGALLVVSMAFAAQLSPRLEPSMRGPGRWLPLSDTEAFATPPQKLPGRWLDVGTLPGFFCFVSALGSFAAGAAYLLPRSPYHALLLVLASACLLPLFCTGRARELPADLVVRPRKLLMWLAERLRKNPRLKVVPWARLPEGRAEADELRLLVMPRASLAGLTAIEVGMEYQQGGGGPIALPCVIVRAQDGSPSYRALPRSVVWTRGRKPEERVTVIRPSLPTRATCLSLVERVTKLLTDETPARRAAPPRQVAPAGQTTSRPRSARSSLGKASKSSKPESSASPPQAR